MTTTDLNQEGSKPPPVEHVPEIMASPERILSTMNEDGSRRWLRPKVALGRFLTSRRVVAYALILLYTVLPHIPINGKPAILLDIAARRFTLFGKTFYPTDTLPLALMMLSLFIGVFLVTSLLGRIWCGWACPQTVYMEFLYRPIQRLFEGRAYDRRARGKKVEIAAWRSVGKYVTYLLVSAFLAHTFLSYFVGVENVTRWMTQSPANHPAAFALVVFITGAMMLDFAYQREQVCTMMCPYGRFQAVLLDKNSLIITYDEQRGEPRGHRRKGSAVELGDCVACNRCVTTCPTGIDIREGLQLECIGCAQCIDACDDVMLKLNKPRGLIRYASQESVETGKFKIFRPRTAIYSLMFVVAASALTASLIAQTASTDVSYLRQRQRPFVMLSENVVETSFTIRLDNRSSQPIRYVVSVQHPRLEQPVAESKTVEAGEWTALALRLRFPPDAFVRGRTEVDISIDGDDGFSKTARRPVMGPFGSVAPQSENQQGDS